MTALFASPVKTNLKKRIEARAKAAGVEPKTAEVKSVGKKEEMGAAAGGLQEVERDAGDGETASRRGSRAKEDRMGPLGLPNDPEGDFEEIVKEVREEIEMRQRKGFGRTRTTPVMKSPGM